MSFNPNLKQNIRQIINEIETSDQMKVLREYARTTSVTLSRIRMPKFISAYRSTRSNLHMDTKPTLTEWAGQVDWANFYSDMKLFYKTYTTPAIYENFMDYYRTVLPYHLSPFNPKIHVDMAMSYGINSGRWSDVILREWNANMDAFIKEIKWIKDDLYDIDSGIEDYEELCLASPMFSILRKTATSAYPDYKKQTIPYILDNYYNAIHSDPKGVVTSYHRRHGYKLVEDAGGISRLQEKDRWVGGVEFVSKVHGLPITYSFRESQPEWTPYYKPWNLVFKMILHKWHENVGNFGFTSDQSKFDSLHNYTMLWETAKNLMNSMPEHIKRHYYKVLQSDFNNPNIVMNAMWKIKLNRWISVSGSAPTPLQETLTNMACHKTGLDRQNIHIIFSRTQIDDYLAFVDKKVDLEELAKFFWKEFGLIMNPDKTETTEKGYIIYLQNIVGKIWIEDLSTIGDWLYEDGIGVYAYAPRRDHRLKFKERIFQTHGDVDFIDEETGKSIDVDVSRMLGTISSYGPMMPVLQLRLIIKYLSKTNTWDRVVEYCKGKPVVRLGEFGWDPRMIIIYIKDNY
jgi:hypothetical protein